MPAPKRSAARKVTSAILFAASVSIFAGPSLSSMAQQPADQRSGARASAGAIDGATAAAIAAEGELKSTIRTFQSDNPSAVLPGCRNFLAGNDTSLLVQGMCFGEVTALFETFAGKCAPSWITSTANPARA